MVALVTTSYSSFVRDTLGQQTPNPILDMEQGRTLMSQSECQEILQQFHDKKTLQVLQLPTRSGVFAGQRQSSEQKGKIFRSPTASPAHNTTMRFKKAQKRRGRKMINNGGPSFPHFATFIQQIAANSGQDP